MRNTTISTLFLLFFLFAAVHIVAQEPDPVIRPVVVVDAPTGVVAEGELDWTAGTVSVTGEGFVDDDVTHPVRRRLLGFRAAKIDAYRKLLEIVGGVQIDARTTVSMAMVASESIRAQVEGLVTGARVVPGSQIEEDGYFRLGLSLDLRGDLSAAMLPGSTAAGPAIPQDLPYADSVVVFVPPKPYTGLVIDARGTSLNPSLSPRIIDDSGRVIYTAGYVDRGYAVRTGVVAYERDLQQAVVSDRIGGQTARPFLVQAIDISGLYNSDAVVTRDMGTRILMAGMEADFLTECRVVFVVGPKPAPPPPIAVFSEATTGDSTLGDSMLGEAQPTGDFLDSILEARALADTLPAEAPEETAAEIVE